MRRFVLPIALTLLTLGTLAAVGCDDDTTPTPPPPDMSAPKPDCGLCGVPHDLSGLGD